MADIGMVTSDRVPRPLANYSQGMRVGDLIFLAGQLASDFETGVPAEVRGRAEYPYYGSDMAAQTRYVLSNIARTLEDGGSSLQHVVKAQVFLTDSRFFGEFDRVWQEFFPTPPPRTTVEVSAAGLLVPGTLVEVDVVAVAADSTSTVEKVDSSLQPLANYTPAVKFGDWVFLAGQLATDFGQDGVPAEARVDPRFPHYGSDIELQTRYTLANLAELLEAAGSDLEHVVKAQVFLKDLGDFAGFDDVWREVFGDLSPPRTTVQVAELLVPRSKLEIDLVAVTKDGELRPRRISTTEAPGPLASYVQAVAVGDVVFAAGQLASDFTTGVAPEARVDPAFPFYGSAIEKQTEYTLGNLDTVLRAAGSALGRSVKAQVFLRDLGDFHGMDKVWRRHLGAVPPPRTTVELPGDGLLVPGTLVEIDLVAATR